MSHLGSVERYFVFVFVPYIYVLVLGIAVPLAPQVYVVIRIIVVDHTTTVSVIYGHPMM